MSATRKITLALVGTLMARAGSAELVRQHHDGDSLFAYPVEWHRARLQDPRDVRWVVRWSDGSACVHDYDTDEGWDR
jgi:hypothetical protein